MHIRMHPELPEEQGEANLEESAASDAVPINTLWHSSVASWFVGYLLPNGTQKEPGGQLEAPWCAIRPVIPEAVAL